MKTSIQAAQEWGLDTPNEYSGSEIIAALDEYSMEMSVAFVIWIFDNEFYPHWKGNNGDTMWSNDDVAEILSTKELYSLFLSKHFTKNK